MQPLSRQTVIFKFMAVSRRRGGDIGPDRSAAEAFFADAPGTLQICGRSLRSVFLKTVTTRMPNAHFECLGVRGLLWRALWREASFLFLDVLRKLIIFGKLIVGQLFSSYGLCFWSRLFPFVCMRLILIVAG